MESLKEYVDQGMTVADIARTIKLSWAATYRRLQAEGLEATKDRREALLSKREFEDMVNKYGSITNIYHQIALVRGWDWAHIHSLYRLARTYGIKCPRHHKYRVSADGTWKWN